MKARPSKVSEEVIPESKVKLIIPAKSEYVGLVRLAVGGLVRNLSGDEEAIEDIKVALSEVCTNVVLQAVNDRDSLLDLTININEDEICIDVGCTGRELELAALTPIVWSEPHERGYGLSLITALMDKVELANNPENRTTLRLKKFLVA